MHGGSKSHAGIKFRRNERSMGSGIPPETGHRYAYSPEQRRALNDYTNYSRLEAANTGHQSYSLMKSRAQDTAPALEAPDTGHTGGSKSRAGIKFRRNKQSDLNKMS